MSKAKTVMDWDAKKFDVLVPKMNDQHEKLVAMMNHLYLRHDGGAGKVELDRLITDLKNYTIKHFAEEETYLTGINFPQLAMHKSIHKKLLEDFESHHKSFTTGPGKLSPQFFEFLRLWLTSHIMHIDRKYGEFATAAKVA